MLYTLKDYFAERDSLLKGNGVPTRDFIKTFSKRREKGWALAHTHGYHNDSEDYHSWGYALFDDIDTNAELAVYDLKVSVWEEFYESNKQRLFLGKKLEVYAYWLPGKITCRAKSQPTYIEDHAEDDVIILVDCPDIKDVYVYWNTENTQWEFMDGAASLL